MPIFSAQIAKEANNGVKSDVRIWSIHPKYLDSNGLVALWRETLLAQKVLKGETRGYRNHPQLNRFKESANPVGAIAAYLVEVHREARERAYNFDASKIASARADFKIHVTDGQIAYEWEHLKGKLKIRDPQKYDEAIQVAAPQVHPCFKVVSGGIEDWEIVTK